ncbi:MAG TPA: TetR/AcrR family transcriptional regulator [Nevskiaceae bacterium]|nr:TetR/AcrR family transcriptional regulator [Nevskiaceae bacterium]
MTKARAAAAVVSEGERPSRGRKPIFSREQVIAAALALVARAGHEALSMRGIAAELGTGVATLYNYFGSLAELHDALVMALLDEIPVPNAKDAREVRRQLKAMVIGYAAVVARYPDFEQMIGPLADQRTLRVLDAALRVMVDAGVDIERAGVSWTVLQSLGQAHGASSRRRNDARRSETRKKIQDLDAVLALAETGVFEKSGDEWFHRVLDLTMDRLLPELNTRKRTS